MYKYDRILAGLVLSSDWLKNLCNVIKNVLSSKTLGKEEEHLFQGRQQRT